MNSRFIAASVINQVSDGQSLSDCLPEALAAMKDPRDRAFVQALVYGVCRFYPRLDVLLSYLLQKPMKAKDGDVHALLMVGLYQLSDMRVPTHAAVAETVNAASELKKPWAKALINAILREYLRKQTILSAKVKKDVEACYAHPSWWILALKKAWAHDWEKILLANNAHPPFSLRVNAKQYSRDHYMALLSNKLSVRAIPHTTHGIIVEPAHMIEQLPGFHEGAISAQDGAAQLAADLLALAPNQRVLDACAAPGGKLCHLLETMPTLMQCVAVDKDHSRVELIKENLSRLQLQATCYAVDVKAISTWWDGKPFDRILLDAPCSGSGVIRRHPDIKLLRQPNDIKALVKEQHALLEALWPLLAPGGKLLYVTCSIFPEENVEVMKEFIKKHPDATESVIVAEWGEAQTIGRQILPGQDEMDGFYYTRISKSLS